MDDMGNTAFRFCKYLGLCTYSGLRARSAGTILVNAQ